MEAVFAIPELISKIFDNDTVIDLFKLIAKARMICRTARDALAPIITTESKIRCGITYTTTLYNLLFVCAQEPYRTTPDPLGFLEEIWCGESEATEIRYANVIHIRHHNYDRIDVGFQTDPKEFAALNRLLGLKSSAYGALWTPEKYRCEKVNVTKLQDDCIHVEIDGVTYHLEQDIYLDKSYNTHYMFYGHLHGCDSDIGHFDNLQRLKTLTW